MALTVWDLSRVDLFISEWQEGETTNYLQDNTRDPQRSEHTGPAPPDSADIAVKMPLRSCRTSWDGGVVVVSCDERKTLGTSM